MDTLPSTTTLILDQPLMPLSRELSMSLAHIKNGLLFRHDSGQWEFPEATADRAPGPEERRWLASRQANIVFWLKPAGEDRARTALLALVALMKNRNPGQNAQGIAALYVKELAGLAWYGLEQACIAFKRNEVGDGWLPTPGELRQEANLRAMWAQEELGTIQAILKAKVPPARESKRHRAAVSARMSDWLMLPRNAPCPPRENYFWPGGEPRTELLDRPTPMVRSPLPTEELGSWGTLGGAMSSNLQDLWNRQDAKRAAQEERHPTE